MARTPTQDIGSTESGTDSTAGSFLPFGRNTLGMPVLPHFGHRSFSYQSLIMAIAT
jgi:hypothetical protein